MQFPRRLRAIVVVALMSIPLALAPGASAHTHIEVGDYHVSIGWVNEPTFVGQPNGVEFSIEDHDEQPVTDLPAGAVRVVVSTAGGETAPLPLEPGFSVEGGFGTLGQYEAELMPTTPGEYTFHFTGTIHDEPVDVTVTSGEDTFSPVRSSTDIEFPVKVPTLADVATRLDRIDGRIQAVQSDAPAALVAARAATEAARAATESADRALLVGSLVGGAGVVLAVAALYLAMRAGRRGAGAA
jgi:hypothetical protein